MGDRIPVRPNDYWWGAGEQGDGVLPTARRGKALGLGEDVVEGGQELGQEGLAGGAALIVGLVVPSVPV